LKAFTIEGGSRLRTILPRGFLMVLEVASNPFLTKSTNLGARRHLWGMKYINPDPMGACAIWLKLKFGHLPSAVPFRFFYFEQLSWCLAATPLNQ